MAVCGLLIAVASLVVAHGLSRPKACGIFPDQGSNPHCLHWQKDSYSTAPPGKSQMCPFHKKVILD